MGLLLYFILLIAVLGAGWRAIRQNSSRLYTYTQLSLWFGFLILGYIFRPNGFDSDNGLEIFFIPLSFAITALTSIVLTFFSYRRIIAPLKLRRFSRASMQHLLFASLPVMLLIAGLAFFSI